MGSVAESLASFTVQLSLTEIGHSGVLSQRADPLSDTSSWLHFMKITFVMFSEPHHCLLPIIVTLFRENIVRFLTELTDFEHFPSNNKSKMCQTQAQPWVTTMPACLKCCVHVLVSSLSSCSLKFVVWYMLHSELTASHHQKHLLSLVHDNKAMSLITLLVEIASSKSSVNCTSVVNGGVVLGKMPFHEFSCIPLAVHNNIKAVITFLGRTQLLFSLC